MATIAPLLLILEDLHWSDEASLEALSHLAPCTPANRLLLVLTCRTAEACERAAVRESLEALDRAVHILRLRLSPFERADAVNLVQRATSAGQTDDRAIAFANRLQDETQGNALFEGMWHRIYLPLVTRH